MSGMKKLLLLTAALALGALCLGCGGTKTLHCDHCGEEVRVEADSNMEEDWIIYCGPCNTLLFGEEGLISPAD